MEPMAPAPDMTGSYINSKYDYVLRIKVMEVEELSNTYRVKLRMLKNLNKSLGCPYEEGDEFIYNMPKQGSSDGLEVLFLE
jgi:hypothetical protein